MSGIYAFIYRISGMKMVSFAVAFVYITILNLVTIYGLGQLLQGVAPAPVVSIINKLFSFPLFILTIIAMVVINLGLIAPISSLEKDKRNQDNYIPVILYTLIAIIIVFYIKYGDALFAAGT